MGQFINKGNAGFRESRNSEYVDKSGLIGFMNSRLNTRDKFVCVTRARRFGKTMAAEMLYAYYDKSCDSHALFDDLEIAGMEGYETHLNKYPTLFLDLSDFIADKTVYGEKFMEGIRKELVADLAKTYPDVGLSPDSTLPDALSAIYQATGEPFVFIVDEWDAPLREFRGSARVEEEWIGFLRSMFKASKTMSALAGVYITGILPMVRYNTQSAMNNFKEFNMISPGPIEQYLGLTEDEVQALCARHGMDFEEMKAWYDGYQAGDRLSVFNPNSVISAISAGKCRSYWTATGAGDELMPYLQLALKDDIKRLVDGESIRVKTGTFNNDLGDVGTRDKIFTALIHLGYLSYADGKARIPNMEVLLYYVDSILSANLGGLEKVLGRSEDFMDAILEGDSSAVARIMEENHNDICGAQEYNSEQSLYTTLRESLVYAHKDYIFHREYPTGKGFADLVLIPMKSGSRPAIVVELKYDKSAPSAIAQIKELNYPQKVAEYSGEIILVGINYDPATKEHACEIERVEK